MTVKHRNINSEPLKVQVICGKGVTKQAHRDECDINQIMARFQKTGIINHVNDYQPQYGDISGDSFQESMLIIAEANTMFEELPSSVRKEFDNNPAKFLKFVEDPDNHEKLVDMGLANQREASAPDQQAQVETTVEENATASTENAEE